MNQANKEPCQTGIMLAPLFILYLSQILLSSAKLPPPIKLCKNDNSLNECVLKQSSDFIKAAVKGIPKYGVPVLDPMYVSKIEQSETGSKSISMNFTLENINIYGLDKTEITKVEIDTSKKFLKLTARIPEEKVVCDYTLTGKFLFLPINGKGKLTLTIDDLTFFYTYRYKLVTKKGVDYMTSVPPSDLIYKPKKMTFNFENLFNGNKALGDATNKMINENWEELNLEAGRGVAQAIGQIFSLMLDKVAGSTPYHELFLKE